jgi:hypothetical protein
LQPTGIALAALAGEPEERRIQMSVAWLARNVSASDATASLSWSLIGLDAHGAAPAHSLACLRAAYDRAGGSDAAPYKLALLTLASHRFS